MKPICAVSDPLLRFLGNVFGICYETRRDAASTLFGYLSLFFFLNAQVPQLYENFLSKSAGSLSLQFIAIWLAGDVANLVGCILTQQLPFQTYLALYFTMADMALVGQYYWYEKIMRKRLESRRRKSMRIGSQGEASAATAGLGIALSDVSVSSDDDTGFSSASTDDNRPEVSHGVSLSTPRWPNTVVPSSAGGWPPLRNKLIRTPTWVKYQSSASRDIIRAMKKHRPHFSAGLRRRFQSSPNNSDRDITPRQQSTAARMPTIGAVLGAGIVATTSVANALHMTVSKSTPDEEEEELSRKLEVIGWTVAWMCTLLYLSSRLPQIYMNYFRKSASGLSLYMFLFAALGNLCYSLSVLSKSTAREHILNSLPFLIGSVGTLMFDGVIFTQFWWYAAERKVKRASRKASRRQLRREPERADLGDAVPLLEQGRV